ncbi:MAG: tape measure protein, partial [Planctomycetota bacterium]|nr:tape measure protein [Planctomycetota bacterium]
MSKAAAIAGRALAGIGIALVAREMLQLGRVAIQMADQWTNITNRIKLYTTTAEETTRVQKELFNVARSTRAEMGATVELWQRLSQANRQLNLDQSTLQGVVTTLNQTLVISGTSAESARAGLIQLGQAFASGQLRGEELRSVMEQMPRLTQALAAGLNTDVAGLREFAEAGELTASRVIEAIQSQAGVINTEFGGMELTVEQAGVQLENSLGQAIAKINEATGASELLAGALLGVAEAIDRITSAGAGGPVLDIPADFVRSAQLFPGAGPAPTTADTLTIGPRELSLVGVQIATAVEDALGTEIRRAEEQVTVRQAPAAPAAAPTRPEITFQTELKPTFDELEVEFDDLGLLLEEVEGRLDLQTRVRRGEAAVIVDQTEREIELLNVRQASERQQAVISGMSETNLRLLDEAQRLERGELSRRQAERVAKQEEAEATKAANAAIVESNKARRDQERVEREFLQTINATLSALQQIANEFGAGSNVLGLLTGVQQLLSGHPYAALATGIITVSNAVRKGAADHAVYQESVEEVNAALSKAIAEMNSLTVAVGGPFAEELRAVQRQAVEPLMRLFQQFRAVGSGSELEAFTGFVNALQEGFGDSLREIGDRDAIAELLNPLAPDVVSAEQLAEFQRRVLDPLLDAFGDVPIDKLVREMFALQETADDAADSISGLTQTINPLLREITGTFDVMEMQLRDQARSEFRAAGGDPHEAARIFRRLRADLRNLGIAESSAVAASGGTTIGIPAGGLPPIVDTGGAPAAVGDFENIIDLSGAARIIVSWEDVIDQSGAAKILVAWDDVVRLERATVSDFGDNHWGDIVDMAALRGNKEGVQYRIPWSEVMDLTRETVEGRFGVNHWGSIVDMAALRGNKAGVQYRIPWSEVMDLTRERVEGRFGVNHWGSIVDMEALRGNKSGVQYRIPWSEAINLYTASLDNFGVDRWSQIVRLSRTVSVAGGRYSFTSGPAKHIRPWSDAIRFTASTLDDHGISRWSQIVLLSRTQEVMGGMYSYTTGPAKHIRPWSDAIRFTAANMDNYRINRWSQIVRLDRDSGNEPSKHVRPVSDILAIDMSRPLLLDVNDAFHLHRLLLDDWTDLFTGPILSREQTPMQFTGGIPGGVVGVADSDAFHLHRLTLDDWSDLFTGPIIDREQPPMVFNVNDIVRLIGKIDVDTLFDARSVRDALVAAIERALADREFGGG